jgi:hypothetical protein
MIKMIDYLGFQPNLFIESSERYKTTLGGVMTIIMILLSILAFAAFGKDMLLKENPILYQYDKFSVENEINFNEIPFLIGLMKDGGFSIQNISRKLEVRMLYTITDASNIETPTQFINYPLVPCSTTNLFKINLMDIKKKLIGDPANFFCMPDGLNLTWFGQFGNPNFRIGELYVNQCVNSTLNNNTCLPTEDIQNDLIVFYAQYIFMDRFYDMTNFQTPITSYWRSDILQLGGYSSRMDLYTTRVLNLKSDEGLILESNNIQKTSQFNSKIALAMGYNPNYFLQIFTDISNISTVLGRKYAKIQTVMANTGGFIKFVMLIMVSFNNYITRFLFIEKIYLKSYMKYNQFYSEKRMSIKKINNTENKTYLQFNNFIPASPTDVRKNSFLQNKKIEKTNSNPILKEKPNKNNKDKIYVKNRRKYKNLTCSSFLVCKKKQFNNLNFLDQNYKFQMDSIKLFYLFKKFNLTEKLIFGILGKKWKNFLVHNEIVEFTNLSKFHKNKTSSSKIPLLDTIFILQNTPKILDTNKALCEEINLNNILNEN